MAFIPDQAPAGRFIPDDPVEPQPQGGSLGQVDDFISAAAHHGMNFFHGGAQLIQNGIDSGLQTLPANPVSDWWHNTTMQDNKAMQQRDQDYQKGTPDNVASFAGAAVGEVAPWLLSGPAKAIQAVGNSVASTAAKVSPKALAKALGGSAQWTAGSLVAPISGDGDYWSQKSQQEKLAAILGAASPAVIGGVSRVVNPSPSAAYTQLADKGVTPTIGQRLGGIANTIEEKSQSLPVIGDFIAQARGRALESWNKATLNQAVSPIGETVSQVGHDGVAEAGDKLSKAYQNVLGKIGGITFDPQFHADVSQLSGMAQNLTPSMAGRFKNILDTELSGRMSPVGGMTAETLKTVDSRLNSLASKYSGSTNASEQELGDAVRQLQSLVNQQVQRAHPNLAPQLNSIDSGWAKLVRIEGAAKAAASNKVNTGVFTPGQLMSAIRGADQSVRDRATARGQALMQDWAQSALSVLGDKIPNSGTFDRAINGGAGLALYNNPGWIIPAAAATGASAAAYSPAGQKALVSAATSRPQAAKALSDALRRYIPLAQP